MIIAFGARRTWISFVITQQTMYRTSGVKLFIRIHGKGRRDLSAVHSMRMSVGNGGPARGQVRKLWRRPGTQAHRDYRNCCIAAARVRHHGGIRQLEGKAFSGSDPREMELILQRNCGTESAAAARSLGGGVQPECHPGHGDSVGLRVWAPWTFRLRLSSASHYAAALAPHRRCCLRLFNTMY